MKNTTLMWMLLGWAVVWLVGAVASIKFSMDYEKRQQELDDTNQALVERIKIYEKLADPNSVQSYVKQLNQIVDNMTRLIRVVESGEEIDAFFGKMDNNIAEILGMIDEMHDVTDDIELKLEAHQVDTKMRFGIMGEEIDEIIDETENISDLDLIKKFDVIENDLRDIRNTLTDIRNSKIGKKIFN